MEINNNKLKEIMQKDPENISEEDMEKLVEEFMNSNLLILCEMSDEDCPIKRENHEFFNFDDIDDFDIIKLEDDEGHEFIPVFTDWDELDELEVPGCAVLVQCGDLVNLLNDNPENNENLDGILINPFTEYMVEIPFMAALELFGLAVCDDSDCNHEHHHHHH